MDSKNDFRTSLEMEEAEAYEQLNMEGESTEPQNHNSENADIPEELLNQFPMPSKPNKLISYLGYYGLGVVFLLLGIECIAFGWALISVVPFLIALAVFLAAKEPYKEKFADYELAKKDLHAYRVKKYMQQQELQARKEQKKREEQEKHYQEWKSRQEVKSKIAANKIACRICLYRPATFLPCHHQAG